MVSGASRAEPDDDGAAALFTRVSGATASQAIVDQVREKLAAGILANGDRLPTERALAAQLGISRNTVRKAISALKQLGLVTIRKGASGGAFISPDGGNAVRSAFVDLFHLGSIATEDLTETRMILLPAIVRLACRRARRPDIAELEANVRRAQAAIDEGDYAERARHNVEFYHLLCGAARNPVLTLMTDALNEVILHYVSVLGMVDPASVMPIRYRLIECLKSRDADAAAAAMEKHLLKLHDVYRRRGTQATKRTAPR